MGKLLVAAGIVSLSAAAQTVDVTPAVAFDEPPSVVMVAPGVQVVPERTDEVFFVDGAWWVRAGATWYRAEDHHGVWARAEAVPASLTRIPPGKYRNYRPGKTVIVNPKPAKFRVNRL